MFFAPFLEGVRGLGLLFVEEQFGTEIKEMRTETCYAAQHWVWEAALYSSDKEVHIQHYVSCSNRVHYRSGVSVFPDLGVIAGEKSWFFHKE